MEKNECKKDSNFCTHFVGDIFNTYHISKCYKYCSYYEARSLMKNDQYLKKVHNTPKQNVENKGK